MQVSGQEDRHPCVPVLFQEETMHQASSLLGQAGFGHRHRCGAITFCILLLTLPALLDAAEEHTDPQTLPQRLDNIDFFHKKIVHMLDCLLESGGIDPSTIPGYDDQPPHQVPPSPSNLTESSPGLAIASLSLADTLPSISSRLSSKATHLSSEAAGPCACMLT